jgi:C4-dicarboxylate-specific signal transduction histidine kinase
MQVIMNLLTNATNYTPPGGRIRLVVEQLDGAVLLRVSDNGMGMSKEALQRVFDLFVQAEPGSCGGLGIGFEPGAKSSRIARGEYRRLQRRPWPGQRVRGALRRTTSGGW